MIAQVARFGVLAVQYGCLVHCVQEYGADVIVCEGPSMEPTIFSKDVLVGEFLTIRRNLIPKGSVVIVRSPSDPRRFICKRLIAGPGDRIPGTLRYVPKGHVWLEGDNKNNSTDSRNFGTVPLGLVRSRAVFKLFPLSDMGFIKEI